ncbi:MAG: hypothetical protein JXR46_02840 [Calditrichaceae bacterium]|nr:hypothetical protein [Calditrichaceae bacterium]MBN2707960.1 hypothetical protein [Calditrichaceae bacterium]RQV95939.1 MAG: hypothetical protein EH224_06115 [Calditrichota bacterium]
MDNIEKQYLGVWWLPDSPENKVGGLLNFYKNKEITLELVGTFSSLFNYKKGKTTYISTKREIVKYPIILGYLSGENQKITLYECWPKKYSINSGLSTEHLNPSVVFLGAHFNSLDEISFKKIKIHYDALSYFLKDSGFKVKLKTINPDEFILDEYSLTYSYPESIDISLEEVELKFNFEINLPLSIKNEMVLSEKPFIVINSEFTKTLDDWINDYIDPLRFLLSFSTMMPSIVQNLNVYIETENNPVEVIFHQQESKIKQLPMERIDKLFFIEEDVKDLKRLIFLWFKTFVKYKSVFDLFFNIEYSPKLDLKNKFLNTIQALEMYHREKYKNHKNWDDEIFKKRVGEILIPFSGKYRKWLKSLTRYANEPNLNERLKLIIESLNGTVNNLFEDQSLFTKSVSDTRNYLTHNNPNLKNKILTGSDLFWASEKLMFILQTSFLTDLDFTFDEINKILNRNERFKNMLLFGKQSIN